MLPNFTPPTGLPRQSPPSQNSQNQVHGIGEFFQNFKQIFGLVWSASSWDTAVLAGLAILGGLVPPSLAWNKKMMIDRVVFFATSGQDAWEALISMLPLLFMILLIVLVNSMIVQGQALAEKSLRSKLGHHINSLIMRKAMSLDLSYFEDAEYYNRLQNARQDSEQRSLDIVVQTFRLFQLVVNFIAFAFLLFRFSPLLVLILLFATLPSFGMQSRFGQLTFRLLSGQAPERREMKYLEELLSVDRYAKEVKLFNFGPQLLVRYTTRFWQLFKEDIALAKRRSMVSVGWASVGLIGYFAAISWIIYRAIARTITFGDAVLYLEVFEQSHYLGQTFLLTLLRLYESTLFTRNVFEFLSLQPVNEKPRHAQPLPVPLSMGIEFRDVSFRYKDDGDWALRNINLTLKPGEKIAVVGLNGAGKTTFVKLLTGLYAPTKGRILLDGIDMTEVDLTEWRKRIGVIFQDFVHYQFTAAENIGIGQIEAMEDRERIIDSARKGGAHDTISNLPNGYDTLLGTWFKNGRELSIGQWQKVALSRIFMRDAEILLMDEPTASLDAEQEYLIFQHFRRLTEGRLSILISHRFSSVRMMDRIIVLDGGSIVEIGSHDELLLHNGIYSKLFSTQAQGYR
jgi:ATP-binding cassette, subfamily B, bacterial